MKMHSTPLEGSYLIDLEKKEDGRGFFARTYCAREFEKRGLVSQFVQANSSLSKEQGTLRGMHYQLSPFAEAKIVKCIKGSLYDVILDLREDSPSFGQSFGAALSAENRTMMYVPEGFAHGFLTLEPDTEVFYFVSSPYSSEHERGVRWNDPQFAIAWPETPCVISERDRTHPDFHPDTHLRLR